MGEFIATIGDILGGTKELGGNHNQGAF